MTRQKNTESLEDKMPKKEFRGNEDYQMSNGELTERYDTLEGIKKNNVIKGKYTIYESDKIKGIRTTIVDKDTGAIIRETK